MSECAPMSHTITKRVKFIDLMVNVFRLCSIINSARGDMIRHRREQVSKSPAT